MPKQGSIFRNVLAQLAVCVWKYTKEKSLPCHFGFIQIIPLSSLLFSSFLPFFLSHPPDPLPQVATQGTMKEGWGVMLQATQKELFHYVQ